MRCTNTWNTEYCHDHSITEIPATVASTLTGSTNNSEDFPTTTVPNIMESLSNFSSETLEYVNLNVTHPAVEFLK